MFLRGFGQVRTRRIEDMAGPPCDADNMYGKLMEEMTLRAYAKEWGLKVASSSTSPSTGVEATRTMRSSP